MKLFARFENGFTIQHPRFGIKWDSRYRFFSVTFWAWSPDEIGAFRRNLSFTRFL